MKQKHTKPSLNRNRRRDDWIALDPERALSDGAEPPSEHKSQAVSRLIELFGNWDMFLRKFWSEKKLSLLLQRTRLQFPKLPNIWNIFIQDQPRYQY